jgi:hypothetical protein
MRGVKASTQASRRMPLQMRASCPTFGLYSQAIVARLFQSGERVCH